MIELRHHLIEKQLIVGFTGYENQLVMLIFVLHLNALFVRCANKGRTGAIGETESSPI